MEREDLCLSTPAHQVQHCMPRFIMPEPNSLIRHAWLPVALDDGSRVFIQPRDISSDINGRRIIRLDTGRPDCDVSLTEFFIGLLAVTLDPQDRRGWAKRYQRPPTSDEMDAAFRPLE